MQEQGVGHDGRWKNLIIVLVAILGVPAIVFNNLSLF
jgi:hypothetical protein